VQTYEEIYRYLLKPKQFKQIRLLMKEQNLFEYMNVQDVSLKNKDFPYVLFTIETDQIFAAQMVGLYLEIEELVPEYTGLFYLPIIAVAQNYDSEINRLINIENSVAHELIHIKDILSLIDKDPSYIERSGNYGMNTVKDAEDLRESIDLEIFKIFYLEPQAFRSDFSKGERMIRTMLLGKILEYECETETEYIEMQLCDYFGNLSEIYKEKFPNEGDTIKKYIDASVVKYGKAVFGESPLERVEEIRKSYPSKMLRAFGITLDA
jgi:hypothetical protein